MRLALFLLAPIVVWAQQPPAKLLPVEQTARRVHEIQASLFASYLPAAEQNRALAKLQSLVSGYVVSQVEAAPEIEWWELRDRLIRVLSVDFHGEPGPDHYHALPYVDLPVPVSRHSPTASVFFTIAYAAWACGGSDCDRLIIETYTLDHGRVRLAARGGWEMHGANARVEKVNENMLLVQGMVTWASSHALPYRAAVYRVDGKGVKALWHATQPELHAKAMDGLLLVCYHDDSRSEGSHMHGSRTELYGLSDPPRLIFHRLD